MILDSEETDTKRKRDLLPIWIKVFLWMFVIMAGAIPIVLIFSFLAYQLIYHYMALKVIPCFLFPD
jgi:hypothetical protein